MTNKFLTGLTIAAMAAAIAVPTPASAHGWGGRGWHGGGRGDGLFFGLLGAGAAVVGAAAYLATAPVRIVADAAEPAPVYAAPAPQPVYYAQPAPAYYAPQPVAYSYPAPAYYYSYRRGYYR